ncbi:MAG: peptidoglycan D,D-transpeptidase FtsI family protein [Bacillota bacterium]
MPAKKRNPLLFKIEILFFIGFLLFSSLILRLGFVQIVQGEDYKEKSEETNSTVYSWSSPRGKFYDRDGALLVSNRPIYSLTYLNSTGTTNEERQQLAEKLAHFLSINLDDLSERELKEYWAQTRQEESESKRTAGERSKLSEEEEYELLRERITDKDLSDLLRNELEVFAIKKILDRDLDSAKIIKEELTTEENAIINEHLAELPGVEVKLNSERQYEFGNTLRQLFGNIGQIPGEATDSYKSAGYELDDFVGTSFLEQQYEDLLRGVKETETFKKDAAGNIVDKGKTSEGEPGKNLILTVDMELQQKVEEIIEEELGKVEEAESAYVVMMEPTTGEILSIAGKKKNGKEFDDEAYGALYNAHAMGSVVKGATLLTGYETGVVSPGDTFLDAPIVISGTPVKKSYVNMGVINDLTALERSSNVYMFHIAMKIGNYDYELKEGFYNPEDAYTTMRNHFAQFGLGDKTGIDLPNEATGYNGGVQRLGNLMDFAIGQFDTYTPLQLAQYISTIANDGVRMQAHLLKQVREPEQDSNEAGRIIQEYTPTVLNTVEADATYIKRVQEGLRLVMNGSEGTAASSFENAEYEAAGKTGTAEVSDGNGGYDYNLTLAGYAPYENPEVAFAVVVPEIDEDNHTINKDIGRKILDAYWD